MRGWSRAQSDPVRAALTLPPMRTFDLPSAWRQLGAYFQNLSDRFGPAWSFMEERFTLRARRTLKAWIETGEAAFRQLLLIEAQKLPSPAYAPEPSTHRRDSDAPRQPAREISERALGIEAAPMFRLVPPAGFVVLAEQAAPRRANMHRAKQRRSPTRALALRLAALQAAFNDVESQIHRMAKVLARSAHAAMAIFIDRPDPLRLPRDLIDALRAETLRVITAAPTDSS